MWILVKMCVWGVYCCDNLEDRDGVVRMVKEGENLCLGVVGIKLG